MTIRRLQPLDCHPAGAEKCGVISLQVLGGVKPGGKLLVIVNGAYGWRSLRGRLPG
jgi:hypothetical protein